MHTSTRKSNAEPVTFAAEAVDPSVDGGIEPSSISRGNYDAFLLRIDGLMGAAPGTPAGDELEALTTLVEAYEAAHWPMAGPNTTFAVMRSE